MDIDVPLDTIVKQMRKERRGAKRGGGNVGNAQGRGAGGASRGQKGGRRGGGRGGVARGVARGGGGGGGVKRGGRRGGGLGRGLGRGVGRGSYSTQGSFSGQGSFTKGAFAKGAFAKGAFNKGRERGAGRGASKRGVAGVIRGSGGRGRRGGARGRFQNVASAGQSGISPLNRRQLAAAKLLNKAKNARNNKFMAKRGLQVQQNKPMRNRQQNRPRAITTNALIQKVAQRQQALATRKKRRWGSTTNLSGGLIQRTVANTPNNAFRARNKDVQVFLDRKSEQYSSPQFSPQRSPQRQIPKKKFKLNRDFPVRNDRYMSAYPSDEDERPSPRSLPRAMPKSFPKVVVHQEVRKRPPSPVKYDDTGLSEAERKRLRELKPSKRQPINFAKVDFSQSTTTKKLSDRFGDGPSRNSINSNNQSAGRGGRGGRRGRGRGRGQGRGQGRSQGRGQGRSQGQQQESSDVGRTVFF